MLAIFQYLPASGRSIFGLVEPEVTGGYRLRYKLDNSVHACNVRVDILNEEYSKTHRTNFKLELIYE